MTILSDIKFGSPIKSEIKDKAIVKCSGVNTIMVSRDQSTNFIGPVIQKAIGISDDKIACNQGFPIDGKTTPWQYYMCKINPRIRLDPKRLACNNKSESF